MLAILWEHYFERVYYNKNVSSRLILADFKVILFCIITVDKEPFQGKKSNVIIRNKLFLGWGYFYFGRNSRGWQ